MADDARYEEGLRIRREVLGEEHVARSLAGASEFARRDAGLRHRALLGCGLGPARPRAARRAAWSTSAMLTALNRSHELRVHVRGAIRNGCTREEIQEVLLQSGDLLRRAGCDGGIPRRRVGARRGQRRRPATAPAAAGPRDRRPRAGRRCVTGTGRIGVVGLGAMGSQMAEALLDARPRARRQRHAGGGDGAVRGPRGARLHRPRRSAPRPRPCSPACPRRTSSARSRASWPSRGAADLRRHLHDRLLGRRGGRGAARRRAVSTTSTPR